MKKTGLGFFLKPRFKITYDISKVERDIIYEKEFNNIKIYIRKDSLFIIELKYKNDMLIEKINNHLFYTQYANIIYFLFKNSYDKIIKEEGLSLPPIILYEIIGDESIVVQKDITTWNINSMSGDPYGKISYNSSCWFPNNRHIIEPSQLEKDVFDKIIEDFEKTINIIIDNNDAMQIILLLQKAHIAMINEQLDISILMSWTVIERIINIMWEELLKERVSNKREKKILQLKEYTVSLKTNELLINNKIDELFLNELDDARKVRNRIMHGSYNMFNREEKINCLYEKIIPLVLKEIDVACKCIKKYYKLEIKISTIINTQIY